MNAITTLAITKERGERMRNLHPQDLTVVILNKGMASQGPTRGWPVIVKWRVGSGMARDCDTMRSVVYDSLNRKRILILVWG